MSSPADVMFANPCKSRQDIRFASDNKIEYMTFDSPHELEKIYDEHDNPKPVLRIHVDDRGASRVPLNKKFGLKLEDVCDVIRIGKPIYGLAFHVGSDCHSAKGFVSAFQTVNTFLNVLKRHSFFKPELLDIGGGFSGRNDILFTHELAPEIRRQLIPLAPQFERVIAEPGRFFAESCCTLKTNVIGKKKLPNGKTGLIVDESVYGMFSGVIMDGFKPVFESEQRDIQCTFTILGQTCDSADVIAEDVRLPCSSTEGDVLTVRNIGAYSWASASSFNGFEKPTIKTNLD